MRSRGVARLVLASLVFLAWSGPAVAQAPPAEIKMGVLPFYNSQGVTLAQQLGYFKDEGVNVTLVKFVGGGHALSALLAGSIDFAPGIGIGPAAFAMNAKAPLFMALTETYHDAPQAWIVVKKGSPLSSVRDLNGKKVAVIKGSYLFIALQQMARAQNLRMTLVEIPPPNQQQALESDQVDAVFAATPFGEAILLKGHKALLDFPGPSLPYFVATGMATTRKFAEAHPEAVTKVVRAMIRGGRWAMDNLDEAKRTLNERLGTPPEVIARINSAKWSRNGRHMLPSVHWQVQQMKTAGLAFTEGPLPRVEDTFVTTFIDGALRGLGPVADPDYDRALRAKLPE